MGISRQLESPISGKPFLSVSFLLGGIDDVVDYGRALFASLSFRSSNCAREVHVLRFRAALNRAGLAHRVRYVLSVLTLTGEIQPLKEGYWFPTPPRFVPLESGAILLAPTDTKELERNFPGVRRVGYARFLPQIDKFDLPLQTLRDWAELRISDTKAWTAVQLQLARESMAPTVMPQNVEFFGLQHLYGRNKATKPIWVRDFKLSCYTHYKVVLCRTLLVGNFYRYYFAHVENGKVLQEAVANPDIVRLQYGIAALVHQPITVKIKHDYRNNIIELFAFLPRPERRLLLALSERVTSHFGKAYRVGITQHMQLITDTLRQLGCEIKTTHVS